MSRVLEIAFRTPGGREVAGVNTTEVFTKTSMLTIAGINLGTTVSQIQVPVTYRYQIALAKDWKVHLRSGKCSYRPRGRAERTGGNRHLQDADEEVRMGPVQRPREPRLLREITPELEKTARAPRYIEAQREQARKTVTEFAAKWLVTQERWKGVRTDQIQVYFADEPIERLRAFGPEFGGAL